MQSAALHPERYQNQAMFRTQILEQRLARHEMQAIEKFQDVLGVPAERELQLMFNYQLLIGMCSCRNCNSCQEVLVQGSLYASAAHKSS